MKGDSVLNRGSFVSSEPSVMRIIGHDLAALGVELLGDEGEELAKRLSEGDSNGRGRDVESFDLVFSVEFVAMALYFDRHSPLAVRQSH